MDKHAGRYSLADVAVKKKVEESGPKSDNVINSRYNPYADLPAHDVTSPTVSAKLARVESETKVEHPIKVLASSVTTTSLPVVTASHSASTGILASINNVTATIGGIIKRRSSVDVKISGDFPVEIILPDATTHSMTINPTDQLKMGQILANVLEKKNITPAEEYELVMIHRGTGTLNRFVFG